MRSLFALVCGFGLFVAFGYTFGPRWALFAGAVVCILVGIALGDEAPRRKAKQPEPESPMVVGRVDLGPDDEAW